MPDTVKFADLVREKYLASGMSRKQAFAIIYASSGASECALTAAFKGTRVYPETARKLVEWALVTHRVLLDEKSLMVAPPRSKGE